MANTTAPESSKDDSVDLSFEEALEHLEALVERLEAGRLSLEDSLRDYEQGMQLVARCRKELDRAEQRVRELRELRESAVETPPVAES